MPLCDNDLILNNIDGSEKKEDFETFLISIKETDYYKFHSKHFKIELTNYRKTKEDFEGFRNDFLKKFNKCLDANFLIDRELHEQNILSEDFRITKAKILGQFDPIREKAFTWVTIGETILIEDFFLMNIYSIRHFPINIEDLKYCWNIVYSDLQQAAKGCAQGLYVQFLKEKKMEINNPQFENNNEPLPETIQTNNQKLKWNGTPSQFGFIIDLLIQGGYLEKPTASFAKDANFYLQIFDIETTNTTLAKELSEGTNSLATKNRNKITIPNKDKLD